MIVLTIEAIDVAKRMWRWLLVGGVLAGLAIGLVRRPEPPTVLSRWTRVVAVATAPRGLDWPGVDSYPEVATAIASHDPEALQNALERAGLEALWVGVTPDGSWNPELPLIDRFAAGGVVRGFRGEYLSSEGMLYIVDRTHWPEQLTGNVLARVAREILRGREPPPLEAFPEALARRQPVEVLVLLRGRDGLRLWRSARAESIAEGLNTAALAARKRWGERVEAMGGPLDRRLDRLDVEVALLFDDGTFASNAESLIDPLIKPVHGVAYEQPGRWRYLLPAATQRAQSPRAAYRRLFRDNGLPEASFARGDLRLYRLRMKTVSVDHGSAGPSRADGPSRSGAASGSEPSRSASKRGSGASTGNSTTNVVPNP